MNYNKLATSLKGIDLSKLNSNTKKELDTDFSIKEIAKMFGIPTEYLHGSSHEGVMRRCIDKMTGVEAMHKLKDIADQI